MQYEDILKTLGNTPIVELDKNIYAKLECKNPTGSSKDRAALFMIRQAEMEGKLVPGGTIIEPTSGNTGIALAYFSNLLGYNCIICMPNNVGVERINLIEKYGGSVILTPAEFGITGSIDMAKDMALEIENSFVPLQFENKANVTAHFKTTGPEILRDLPECDVVVCGIGTGGTITGIAKYLKMKSDVYIVGVEPSESPILTKNKKGSHGILGIGAGFKPNILDMDLIDEVLTVSTDDAYDTARDIMTRFNVSVGISSGAAYKAALKIKEKMPNKKIVVIFPDDSSKYISTKLFK